MKAIIYILFFCTVSSFQLQNVSNSFGLNRGPNISPRIIGGQEAAPHAYPYQVGIYVTYTGRKDFCGGSLVSANYVLTAAHCVENAVNVLLILGAHDITTQESTQIRLTSTQYIIHNGWNSKALKNDIALIKLPSPVNETNYIKHVKIAAGKNTFAGSKGIATGWGKTSNKQQSVTAKLRYLTADIISNDDCKAVDADYSKIVQPAILCISGKGTVGSCGGDSGGPMTVNGEQVGLVSFGNKDCEKAKPSVFTRLTEYTDWLKTHSDIKF